MRETRLLINQNCYRYNIPIFLNKRFPPPLIFIFLNNIATRIERSVSKNNRKNSDNRERSRTERFSFRIKFNEGICNIISDEICRIISGSINIWYFPCVKWNSARNTHRPSVIIESPYSSSRQRSRTVGGWSMESYLYALQPRCKTSFRKFINDKDGITNKIIWRNSLSISSNFDSPSNLSTDWCSKKIGQGRAEKRAREEACGLERSRNGGGRAWRNQVGGRWNGRFEI